MRSSRDAMMSNRPQLLVYWCIPMSTTLETPTVPVSNTPSYTAPPVADECIYRGRLEPLPLPEQMPSAEQGADAMFTDGCVQFPDLFSAAEVKQLRDWMDRSGEPDQAYEFKNWCFNKHLEADLRSDVTWLPLIDRSPVCDVLEGVLGKDFICYGGSLWVTGQGREMPIHADFLLMEMPGDVLAASRVKLPVFRASLHIYLDDQVPEIGPTLVIPGSHLAGHKPKAESTWHGITPKMVSVKAGGAMLFRHDVWHGAARNTSTRRRYMIQVHYALRWHHYPQARMVPAEVYQPALLAQTNTRQRRLLGGS
jgi:hypothetical protein